MIGIVGTFVLACAIMWFFGEIEAHPIRMGLLSFGPISFPYILQPLIDIVSGIQKLRLTKWITRVLDKWVVQPVYIEARFLLM